MTPKHKLLGVAMIAFILLQEGAHGRRAVGNIQILGGIGTADGEDSFPEGSGSFIDFIENPILQGIGGIRFGVEIDVAAVGIRGGGEKLILERGGNDLIASVRIGMEAEKLGGLQAVGIEATQQKRRVFSLLRFQNHSPFAVRNQIEATVSPVAENPFLAVLPCPKGEESGATFPFVFGGKATAVLL